MDSSTLTAIAAKRETLHGFIDMITFLFLFACMAILYFWGGIAFWMLTVRWWPKNFKGMLEENLLKITFVSSVLYSLIYVAILYILGYA